MVLSSAQHTRECVVRKRNKTARFCVSSLTCSTQKSGRELSGVEASCRGSKRMREGVGGMRISIPISQSVAAASSSNALLYPTVIRYLSDETVLAQIGAQLFGNGVRLATILLAVSQVRIGVTRWTMTPRKHTR